jgi:DNA-binding IclR family transcriptional regulator
MNDTGIKLQSVQRVSEIIELIQSEGPMGTTEITNALDVPTSTAHDYLSSLNDLDYLVKTDGKYDLGLRLLDHGIAARERHPVAELGRSTIEQLAATTGEAVWLVTEESGYGVYLDYALGEQAVQTYARIGTRSPLHCLASGKSILAHLPEERVTEIVERRGLEQRTEHTVGSLEELLNELEVTRERGYAMNDEEAISGTRAVGTAIVVDDAVVGAISTVGPANRMTDRQLDEGIIDHVLGAANELELKLGQT